MITLLNELAEVWWHWMWPMFYQVSGLIIIIAVIDWFMRKRVWPQVRYALWLLVLVKLILPPTFSLSTSVVSQSERFIPARPVEFRIPGADSLLSKTSSDTVPSPAPQGDKPVVAPTELDIGVHPGLSATGPVLQWQVYAMGLWFAGMVALLIFALLRMRHLLTIYGNPARQADLPPGFDAVLAQASDRLGLKRLPRIALSQDVLSPAVIGPFRPALVLPATGMGRLTRQAVEHILLHELAHIKRGDLKVNTLGALLQIVYWFNPLLLLVQRRLRHLRELCCDATVARFLQEQTTDYRETILENAQWLLSRSIKPGLGFLGLVEDSTHLLTRLKWLEKKTWKHQRIRCAAILALVAVMSVCVLPMAKAQKAEKTDSEAATGNVITDPNTGLEFHKAASLVGEQDIVWDNKFLTMSPNAKFLLSGGHVVPVEGGKPFKLVDLPTSGHGEWSPDGKKVAYITSDSGLYMITVSPDTTTPIGPPKKIVDDSELWVYRYKGSPLWSPDSQTIMYQSTDGCLWSYSVKDDSKVQVTDEPAWLFNWHPDGNWIACVRNDDFIWLVPTTVGTPRKLVKAQGRATFSPDGNWIFWQSKQKLHLVRISDALCIDVDLPARVGQYLSLSPDRKKMLFYKPSYGWKRSLKIISSSGGAPVEPLEKLPHSGIDQQWTADSRFVASWNWERYWMVPINGGEPFPLQLSVDVPGKLCQQSFSPDGKKLLFSAKTDGKEEYYVVPVSLEQGRTSGNPVKVFDKSNATELEWSPESDKLVVLCEHEIWLTNVDGTPLIRLADLTKTDGRDFGAAWSSHGRMFAWKSFQPATVRSAMYVCQLPNGMPKRLLESNGLLNYKWSPDGIRIVCSTEDEKTSSVVLLNAVTGESKTLIEVERQDLHEAAFCAFSPNGREIAVCARDKVQILSLSNGESREIADLNDPSKPHRYLVPEPFWSPDGQKLALISYLEDRIFTVPARGGEFTELAPDDKGDKAEIDWSPDGKWISYSSAGPTKTRSEGVLWEVEIDSFLERAAKESGETSRAVSE